MPLYSIKIKPDKARPVYHQGEYVTGKVSVDTKYELKHAGLLLSLEGFVEVSANFRNLNLLSTFNGTSRTIPLLQFTNELIPAGRLQPGLTEVPFKILLDESVDVPTLFETYHGVFISIQYFIKCRIKRTLFYKDLTELLEFIVEYDAQPIGAPPLNKQPFKFEITPDSLSAPRPDLIPNLKIVGQLDSLIFRMDEPISGEFFIETCEAVIRSIELQLVRVETYSTRLEDQLASFAASVGDKDFSRDATEVQNIQIGDGNVLRKMPLSIRMVLPRLFTCPTLITNNFSIGK